MYLLTDGQLAAFAGFGGGVVLGLAARLARFCTLGAVEDALYGGTTTRLRMWAIALGTAIIGVAMLTATGMLDPSESFYLTTAWNPLASVAGGLLFGLGMAFAGNCGYGALARCGGGDLRSLVLVIFLGLSAYMTIAGPLAYVRIWLFGADVAAVHPQSIAHMAERLLGVPATLVGLLVGGAFLIYALRQRLAAPALFWSVAVGLAIVSGFGLTAYLNATGFEPVPVVSHSFAAPVGQSLLYAMTSSGQGLSFAVGSVAGVVAGAFVGSLWRGQLRWEACEDPRELRRQILGAGLMGFGSVVALGCSVGQGLSAFAVLALSAPVTLAAIGAGAVLGLHLLVAGNEFAPLLRRMPALFPRRD